MDQTSDTNSVSWRFFAAVCGLGLAALLAWDGLGLDMALAAPWGGPGGFALRDDWWLSKIMHEGARALAWLVFLALAAGIWRPWGVFRGFWAVGTARFIWYRSAACPSRIPCR